jgi:hypothetical protein
MAAKRATTNSAFICSQAVKRTQTLEFTTRYNQILTKNIAAKLTRANNNVRLEIKKKIVLWR